MMPNNTAQNLLKMSDLPALIGSGAVTSSQLINAKVISSSPYFANKNNPDYVLPAKWQSGVAAEIAKANGLSLIHI